MHVLREGAIISVAVREGRRGGRGHAGNSLLPMHTTASAHITNLPWQYAARRKLIRVGRETDVFSLLCQLNKVISKTHFEQQLLNKQLYPQMAIDQIVN